MPTATFYITNGGNDTAYGHGSFFDAGAFSLVLGEDDGLYTNSLLFSSVNIPPGATINSAVIRFYCIATNTWTPCLLDFFGNDVDDAVAPTNLSEADALVPTTASEPWDVPGWTEANSYDSPSLAGIIQEIVDRPGWSSGNDLQIIIEANASCTKMRLSGSYDESPSHAPQLIVTYNDEPEVFGNAGLGQTFDLSSPDEHLDEGASLDDSFVFFNLSDEFSEGLSVDDLFEADYSFASRGTAAINLPSMVGDGELNVRSGRALVSLPGLLGAAAGQMGIVGRTDAFLPGLEILASGLSGSVGQITLAAPMLTLSSAGWTVGVGTLDLTLPSLLVNARGAFADVTFRVLALNPKKLSVTEYSGWAFNSFCTFAGRELAATESGIHVLGGDKDAGRDITGEIILGQVPMEGIRARDVWLGGRSDGDMEVILAADEGTAQEFVTAYLLTTLGQDRARVPRGLKPVYLQVGVKNVAGSGFDLDALQVYGEPMKRKKR